MLDKGNLLDKKYEIIRVLGQGGMGSVYLCKNINLDTLWAIKEVPKEVKGNVDFLAEPNILKKLKHPGIPRIIDIFYENDNLYMVEDYIEGENLKQYVNRKGKLSTEELCKIASEIANIVSYLHSFDPAIIHRDLKPSNIMMTPEFNVVLIDFGISRIYKPGQESDTVYIGSKGYAAPEQFYGTGQSSVQTDIYALGAVMYFMLTGKTPSTALEPLYDENYEENANNDVKEIIKKSMKINADGRHGSVGEMKNEILRVSEIQHTTLRTKMFLNKNNVLNSERRKPLFKSLAAFFIIVILIILGTYSLVYSYKEMPVNTNKNVDNVNNLNEEVNKNPQVINLDEDLQKEVEEDIENSNINEGSKNANIKEENTKEKEKEKEKEEEEEEEDDKEARNDNKKDKGKGKAKGKSKK